MITDTNIKISVSAYLHNGTLAVSAHPLAPHSPENVSSGNECRPARKVYPVIPLRGQPDINIHQKVEFGVAIALRCILKQSEM